MPVKAHTSCHVAYLRPSVLVHNLSLWSVSAIPQCKTLQAPACDVTLLFDGLKCDVTLLSGSSWSSDCLGNVIQK